jgi:hypothetical protein
VKKLLALLAAALLSVPLLAASVVVTSGQGPSVIVAGNDASGNASNLPLPAYVPVDATGAVITGSGSLPVGAATSALQTSVGATAHTDAVAINTTLGTPMQNSGGSVSATNFPLTVSTGAGAAGASSPRQTVAQDATTVAGSAPGTAGTPSTNVVSVQGVASGTILPVMASGDVANAASDSGNPVKIGTLVRTSWQGTSYSNGQRANVVSNLYGMIGMAPAAQGLSNLNDSSLTSTSAYPWATDAGNPAIMGVTGMLYNSVSNKYERPRPIGGAAASGAGTFAVAEAPTSSANASIVPVVSTALEGCHVLKSSAGNLYSLSVTIQATTGIVQLFNATSAPSDGAVTPIWSQPVISNATLGGATWSFAGAPVQGSTGLTVCFSSATTPFTKTASATAMFSAGVE